MDYIRVRNYQNAHPDFIMDYVQHQYENLHVCIGLYTIYMNWSSFVLLSGFLSLFGTDIPA